MAGLGTNIGTSFNLQARMNGVISIGGQSVPVWYFSDSAFGPGPGPGPGHGHGDGFMGDRDLPSAHIEAIEGQLTTIDFVNHSPMPHTIHLHGLDVDQANDGVPQTSFSVPHMGTATYQFVAPHAGTYHYHCHVDTVIHYAKGMHGTVIVRPPDAATNVAWTGGPTFDEEVLWQVQTLDTVWNLNEFVSGPGTARYHPDAFLLNGKETLEAAEDPFSRIVLTQGQTAYVRVVNSGYNWARVSLAGMPFEVVASDGRPLPTPLSQTTLELGPGERYDLLFAPDQQGRFRGRVEFLDNVTNEVVGQVLTRIFVA